MCRKLKVVNSQGEVLACEFFINDKPEPSLRLKFRDFDSGEISANKLFYCLEKLHTILDQQKIKLLCNGCRYDVWPSGMALRMGQGVTAYKHTLFEAATRDDWVDIFDPTEEIDSIRSLDEKKEYQKEWISSIGRRN